MGLIVPRVRVSPSFKIFALTLLLLTAGGVGGGLHTAPVDFL